MPDFDQQDAEILALRIALRDRLPGPRLGDYVEFADGRVGRLSYDWGDDIQWSRRGRFYLGHDGRADFSGSLEPPVRVADLELVSERPGNFWFFHHDSPAAHNGVDVVAPCHVYLHKPGRP